MVVTVGVLSHQLLNQPPHQRRRAAVTTCHTPGGLAVRSFRRLESKVQVLAGLAPLQACVGESILRRSPGSWRLAGILGVPWFVDAAPCSLSSWSRGVLQVSMPMSVFHFPPLYVQRHMDQAYPKDSF